MCINNRKTKWESRKFHIQDTKFLLVDVPVSQLYQNKKEIYCIFKPNDNKYEYEYLSAKKRNMLINDIKILISYQYEGEYNKKEIRKIFDSLIEKCEIILYFETPPEELLAKQLFEKEILYDYNLRFAKELVKTVFVSGEFNEVKKARWMRNSLRKKYQLEKEFTDNLLNKLDSKNDVKGAVRKVLIESDELLKLFDLLYEARCIAKELARKVDNFYTPLLKRKNEIDQKKKCGLLFKIKGIIENEIKIRKITNQRLSPQGTYHSDKPSYRNQYKLLAKLMNFFFIPPKKTLPQKDPSSKIILELVEIDFFDPHVSMFTYFTADNVKKEIQRYKKIM